MAKRCPYHVRQGAIDSKGNLSIKDVCGAKSAQCASCEVAPFEKTCFLACPRYIAQQSGGERHVLVPKSEMEYLPELGGVSNFSEMELM